MGDEVLCQSVLGDIFIGHGADGYFILYESHGLLIELLMVHLELLL